MTAFIEAAMPIDKIPALYVVPDFYQTNLWLVPPGAVAPPVGTSAGLAIERSLQARHPSDAFWFQVQYQAWIHPDAVSQAATWDRINLNTPLERTYIAPGSPILDFGFGRAHLTRTLLRALDFSYHVLPWGYDWRRSFQNTGQQLAQHIIATGSTPAANAIFAVGAGAIVAQWAMGYLAAAGKSSLVGRVLAVAPIFSGTYAPAQAWRGQASAMDIGPSPFSGFLNTVGQIFNPFARSGVAQATRAIMDAVNSWDATYDLLPDPGLSDDASDVLRSKVWEPKTWDTAPFPPDAVRLAAAQARQAVLHSAAYRPDATKWVVVAIVDRPFPTPAKMLAGFPAPAGTPSDRTWYFTLPSFQNSRNGDGRCTVNSQNPYSLPQVLMEDQNWDAPVALPLMRQLSNLLRAQPTNPQLLTAIAS